VRSQYLLQEDTREKVMAELHQQLQKKGGDDDISFIWIQPGKEEICPHQ
jgi:hypothetical protein